ncbi:G-type lectin S-receptor-like serine/threonine-protein kinase [Hordeum vulgare]|nr:G-type lectin S-receptor-like serine/threonine-protein kinase [Hordeum vulgare]
MSTSGSFCFLLIKLGLLDVERRGRLELAEQRRQRLELPDRQPNLSNSSKEDATKCLVSLGDLIDVEKLGGGVAGSATLHLRVTGMATAAQVIKLLQFMKNKKKVSCQLLKLIK